MVNLFELASRKAYRFKTSVGELMVEQLWDLPINSNHSRGVCLRKIAEELNAQIQPDSTLDWLGSSGDTIDQEDLKNKLAIIKHIVETRRAEIQQAQEAEAKRSMLDRLLKIKQKRADGALENMSDEDLDKMIADLK